MVNFAAFFGWAFNILQSRMLLPLVRKIQAVIGHAVMFVYRKESLPRDPVFPANLKQLGYFINDQDQIRMIADPQLRFLFKISSNDRYNEMQREAMDTCIREIVSTRLHELGLETLRLPIGAGPRSPHVPILVSPNLETRTRVIVAFGESTQDLGIWAYRLIGDNSINFGSAVEFASAVFQQTGEGGAPGPGLILANPGQLVWHRGGERAVSLRTWHALPRKYAVEPPMKMGAGNRIPGNETWQDHVTYVFEEVLGKVASKDAKIDIIGLAEGGIAAIRYLAEHWPQWQNRISAIALSNPMHDVNHLHPPEFAKFISTRCRAYQISSRPLDEPVDGRYEFGCNCFSSGEPQNVECIMPRAWKSMLNWLNTMHENPEMEEVEVLVMRGDEEEPPKVAKNGDEED